MGFASCGMGGDVYFWDLINAKENGYKIQDKDLNQKGVHFSSVVNIPEKTHEVFVCGNDRKVWNSNMQKSPFEIKTQLSQLQMTHNGKALLAGVGEEGRPGSIFVFRVGETPQGESKLEKINEIQAHSKPIERLKLTYDNHHLISAGNDGCLIIHDIKDRDPKGKQRERECLPFSDEILTEKNEIDQINQEIEQLTNDLNGSGPDGGFDRMLKMRKLDEKIAQLEEHYVSMKLNDENKYLALNESKSDLEKEFEEKIKQLEEKF